MSFVNIVLLIDFPCVGGPRIEEDEGTFRLVLLKPEGRVVELSQSHSKGFPEILKNPERL